MHTVAFLAGLLLGAGPGASIDPPRPTAPLVIPYPAGARGDATVHLEVEIDAAGQIRKARALSGEEPFRTAAETGALGFRFEPARRDGTPIAVRVGIDVVFREPRASPPEPPLPLAEVRVRGKLPEPSQTTLSMQEVREIPGALGDPVRAVTALPGVTAVRAIRPEFFLRGAPPQDTGYFVDGVRVPLVFHGGVATSVIQPALLKDLALYPSAPPARFGGFAGGILELTTLPPSPRTRVEARVQAFEAGALVETPLQPSSSVLLAGRIGYPALVTRLFSPDVSLGYGDYQARLATGPLSVLAFGSHDSLVDTGREQLFSDFHRVDLRYASSGPAGSLEAGVTGGLSSQGALGLQVVDASVAARLRGEIPAGSARVRAGLEVERDDYGTSGIGEDPAAAAGSPADGLPPPINLVAAAHADVVVRPLPFLEVTPGLRAAVLSSDRPGASAAVPALEPRLALRTEVAPGAALLTSAGLAHQLPLLRAGGAPTTVITVPGFPRGDHRLQESVQAAQGVRLQLPAGVVLTSSLFGSRTAAQSALPETCSRFSSGPKDAPAPDQWLCADARVEALAYGLEVSMARPLSRPLSFLLSYTLSKSTQRYPGGPTVLAPYDRTHVLTAAASWDFGSGYRLGAGLTAYSGTPAYVRYEGGRPVLATGLVRLPPFARLDIRTEKRWDLAEHRSIALVLEVQNAGLSRESDRVDCGPPLAAPGACVAGLAPGLIIPSIGVEASL